MWAERGKQEKIGLVEEVVEQGQALEAALALAAKVARQSPSSVAACKSLIQMSRDGSINSALPLEREKFVALFDTQDQKEGVTAFLEKRKPTWVNG